MADWGEFMVDPGVSGGVLYLHGRDPGEARVSSRVYAGPRRGRNEEHRGSGIVETRTLGTPTAALFGTPDKAGRLSLYGPKMERAVVDGHDVVRVASFSALSAGCFAGDAIEDRWGFLRLQAISEDRFDARYTVRLESEGRRGRLEVHDAFNPSRWAVLGVGLDGPFLYMTDGRRAIEISPGGISQNPDKGGGAGPPREDQLEGIVHDPLPGVDEPRFDLPPAEAHFFISHPEDREKEIYYNVLEGPEVGVYARGSARLVDGMATVSLPDHFRHVAAGAGLTVQLTPRSAESKGVAATSLTVEELVIVELGSGKGSYDVDYVVHGVRRGREGFEVVRPRATPRREPTRCPVPVEEDDIGEQAPG